MKALLYLISLITIFSCKNTSNQQNPNLTNSEVWEISNKTIQKHSYNKIGLLDTTLIIEYSYVKGIEVDKKKSLISRKYDNRKNLILERTSSLLENGETKLVTETVSEYDESNNLIIERVKSKGVDNGEKRLLKYNAKNQLIRSLSLSRKFETYSKDEDLDTILNHYNKDNIQLNFDTTLTEFIYDAYGNCIKEITLNTKKEIKSTRVHVFKEKEEIASYNISNINDTTAYFTYTKAGNLTLHILNNKDSGSSDTSWYDGKNEIKYISHEPRFKFKTEIKYDEKNNEIESITYK